LLLLFGNAENRFAGNPLDFNIFLEGEDSQPNIANCLDVFLKILCMKPMSGLKAFWGILLTASVTVSITAKAIALTSSEIGKIAQDVTVLIDVDGAQLWGSGVLIHHKGSTYTVLTAKHVIEQVGAVSQIEMMDGNRYPLRAQTIKMLPNVDLAVLEFTSDRPYRVAQLADSDQLTIGTEVYTAGFPAPGQTIQEREFRFTKGEIASRPTKAQADGYSLVYTNITRRGMSGGPVLNDDGRLVGIHGRADGDSIQTENTATRSVVVKDVNLGIPINAFLSLAPKAGIQLSFQANASPARPPTPSPQIPTSTTVSIPAFQSDPSPSGIASPALQFGRPKPIRPSTSPDSAVCAGSRC
jgi:serine protease Do